MLGKAIRKKLMRIAVISAAFIALSSVIASATLAVETKSTDASLADIVIADELRTAFYEHAPITLSGAVSKAVRSWCSSADRPRVAHRNESSANTVDWLCAKHKLRYFRSVYINGDKGPHVLVCQDNGISESKYFGIDLVTELIGEGTCVATAFDGTDYVLDFEAADAASDASEPALER
jgi:hypothetical protein